jgi:cyanophycinase
MATGQDGIVALAGAGEFLATMLPVDTYLVEQLQKRQITPRVAIVPTASAPDGEGVPQKWAKMGVEHFVRLGIEAEPVMLLTRRDAGDPAIIAQLSQSSFVYLSGGKPRYLMDTLHESAAWQAILGIFRQGGVVAGCSAGAMVLGGAFFDFPQFWRTRPALGLVPGIVVIPHFDELPKPMLSTFSAGKHKEVVIGIDGGTALIVSDGFRIVQGKGGVTVFNGPRRVRYQAGETIGTPRM